MYFFPIARRHHLTSRMPRKSINNYGLLHALCIQLGKVLIHNNVDPLPHKSAAQKVSNSQKKQQDAVGHLGISGILH